MDMQRFSEIIMAYGGNPQHWSEHEREEALQILQQSEEARYLQKEALQLDALLDIAPMPQLSPAFQKRILKSAQPSVFQRFFEQLTQYSTLQLATVFGVFFFMTSVIYIAMPFSQPTNDIKNDLSQEVSLVALLEEELSLAELLL
ncbi:MAG: hypothetical protein RIT27_30 [Pseudomonadota bacterium]|jgi:hypothetical protein